jgi:serine/threonine-protein kinase
VVYEAFDTVIERAVALKMLRTDVFPPEQLADVRARFKREAHSAGRLSHPNIVTVFDYGEHEDTPYIAMDLMVGEELSRSLDSGARLALPQVMRVMDQLLAALAYAHENGVVHRDIKPSNVFVLRDGSIKVVDFGLARIETSNLTESGAVLGTPAYMSPEQFLGLPADARSDIFSSGVMLYQMLTGDRPFSGSPTTIMQKVLRQDPVEPSVLNPTLSAEWDKLIKRVLAKKPDDRLQSAREFAEWMRRVFEGKPLPDAPELAAEATVRLAPQRPRKRGRAWLIAGVSAVAVLAALAAAGLHRRAAPKPAPVAQAPAPVQQAAAPVPQEEAPVPKPKAKARQERKQVKPEPKPEPAPAPVAAARPTPPPAPPPARMGKVVKLDHNWGFLVVHAPDAAVKIGDRLYANLADGRRVPLVVRRISGNLVSAVPEGQKISDEMLGALVTLR